jgi:hypothetical protein
VTHKLLTMSGMVLLLIAGAARGGDFGSYAQLDPYAGGAGAWTPGGRGFANSRVDFDSMLQYSRGTAIDVENGLRTSHSYAIRLPDGRVIANSFNLGVAPADSFFGSSEGQGGYSASAGGRLDGWGSGMTWAHSLPSFAYPAYSQGYSRSFP